MATLLILYLSTAFFTEAGMARASGRELRETLHRSGVIPTAVVEVPIIGTPLALASGPTTFISVLSVGPRIATTCWELISFWAAARACSCLPEESSINQVDLYFPLGVQFVPGQFKPVGDGLSVSGPRAGDNGNDPDLGRHRRGLADRNRHNQGAHHDN